MTKTLLVFFLLTNITLVAQTTGKEVTAKKGDGIYTLLRKNGLEPTTYFKAFIALNKDRLKNNELLIGKTYVLPIVKQDTIVIPKDITTKDSVPLASIAKLKDTITVTKSKTVTNTLFGKKHEVFPRESKTLKGAVYYLISGHGGPDPGAIETYNGKLIAEDEYAYDVTLRLARKLLANGAKVYIIIKDKNDGIRDKRVLEVDYDEVCYPNNQISLSQKLRLYERTKAVNKLYLKHKGAYQRLIVTHVDSRSKGKNIDVFFYHHHKSKSGKTLALNIHNTFKKKYAKHQPNRIYSGTVSSRKLYVIKNTLPAMVYIELGNIKNKKDQKRILNYNNREAMAKWIYEGLLMDFGST
ncbi:N-acetylmuramoyl-L-alanine amidase family protein [Hyunsoonleella ulvae]|uniref:N-acetylmuramoyl-L-alanine amidase family protein n=1 Tax=Hyunsoonleella ulvae TaxID=2799948 RepID=UPI00193AB087|nr:N-acetylmuramoyl-L-alanine amidase [Hyunsoonleella ulvae]